MAMPMPKPTEAHRRLEALAGRWSGEETVHPGPFDARGGRAVGRTNARMSLDGFFLVYDYEQEDYEQEREGKVGYRGHGVIGYDPKAGVYTSTWFDNTGGQYERASRGRFEGDLLVFTNEGPGWHARFTYDLSVSGRYSFRIETSADGASWTPFLDGTYARI